MQVDCIPQVYKLSEIKSDFQSAGRRKINRVTVYRILDLLLEKGLLEKISTADRALHFGMAPNSNHPPHPLKVVQIVYVVLAPEIKGICRLHFKMYKDYDFFDH